MIAAEQTSRVRTAPRVAFGVFLFLVWVVATVVWVASTIHSVADGDVMPLVTALAALSLIMLLACMEGLEVAAIDRWRVIYPDRTSAGLAAWLAARQFFVAAVVTSATLLVKRDELIIPGTSAEIPEGVAARLFDLFWTGLTVLWFGQIFPKHLAATNPDRYLRHLRSTMFPVVDIVRRLGVSQPGEWTAAAVERRLDWPAAHVDIEEGPPRRRESLAEIWRQLIPESAPPSTRSADRLPPAADRP
jgi:hypothetical protein